MSYPKEPLRKGDRNEVIQVHETYDIATGANTTIQADVKVSKVELLSKLYIKTAEMFADIQQKLH